MHAYYLGCDPYFLFFRFVEMGHDKELAEIPGIFYSFHAKGPFSRCIECERDLLKDGCEYVIEKAVRNYPGYQASDVIFDYAICMDCAMKMHNELSRESLETIQNFFVQHLNVEQRSRNIAQADGNIEELISRCMISEKAQSESAEYQIFAHCIGDKINMKNPPYMLSGEVLLQLSDLISEKTRDNLNGFFDKHFSPDPTLMEPTPRLILV